MRCKQRFVIVARRRARPGSAGPRLGDCNESAFAAEELAGFAAAELGRTVTNIVALVIKMFAMLKAGSHGRWCGRPLWPTVAQRQAGCPGSEFRVRSLPLSIYVMDFKLAT